MRYFLSFLLIVAYLQFAHADFIDPASVQVKTEKYVPQTTDFRRGVYEYEVSWQGIPVADASIDVQDKENDSGSAYFVQANAKTNKFIAIFYKLRHTSDSLFLTENLKPIKFSSRQSENSRIKKSEIVFGEDGQITSVLEKNGKIENERTFVSDNLTLDPISAAFLARSIPIEVGSKAAFDVYNAKNRFLISFEVTAIEEILLPGQSQKRKAFKVIPTLTKLTDTEGEKRFRKAEIWIAADETRDVLKVESEVLVGSVGAYLKGFKPHEDKKKKENDPSLLAVANLP